MHCGCPINSRNSKYGLLGSLGDLGQFLLLLFLSKSWFFSSVTYNWSGRRGWLVDWFLKLSFCYEVVFLPPNKISWGNPMGLTLKSLRFKEKQHTPAPFFSHPLLGTSHRCWAPVNSGKTGTPHQWSPVFLCPHDSLTTFTTSVYLLGYLFT